MLSSSSPLSIKSIIFVILKIFPCNYSDDPSSSCDHEKLWKYIQDQTECCRGIQITSFTMDDVIYPEQRNITLPYINIDPKAIITDRFG